VAASACRPPRWLRCAPAPFQKATCWPWRGSPASRPPSRRHSSSRSVTFCRSTHVDIELRLDAPRRRIEIESTVACRAATGVEMEAIVAVAIAAATIYDMCKAIDRAMRIEAIELMEKSGGRSGTYRRRAAGRPA
jgi:hypothetical protein